MSVFITAEVYVADKVEFMINVNKSKIKYGFKLSCRILLYEV